MSATPETHPSSSGLTDSIIAKAYNKFVRPTFVDNIHPLGIDVTFNRAEGDYLYYNNRDGVETRVLDMAGGAGVTLLGHNHPELVAHASSLLARNIPFHGQRSIRRYATELALVLNEILARETRRRYVINYANSGSEANELAVKHAHFERQSLLDEWKSRITSTELPDDLRQHNESVTRSEPIFAAVRNGFHGKTNSSLAVSYSQAIKVPSLNRLQPTIYMNDNSTDDLRSKLSPHEDKLYYLSDGNIVEQPYTAVIGIICEPILGDGGIIELQEGYLRALREWASRYHVPLIFDEIQSGVGRTGDFLASTVTDVVADYYTLSKALSGGIGKVSVLAVDTARFINSFALVHSSTYNEDDWSCSIALRAMELLDECDVYRLARESGHDLRSRLLELMRSYPELISEVRGRGLMLGIAWSQGIEQLIPLDSHPAQYIEGILFREYAVRVGTVISSQLIIRITPSALISKDSRDRFIDALESLCLRLSRGDWR